MTRRFYRVTGRVLTETSFSTLVEAGNPEHAFNLVQGGNVELQPEDLQTDEATRNVLAEFVDLESEE